MPTTVNYYNNLITKLNKSSAAKKLAYDIAYQNATSATFDEKGNIAGYKKYNPETGKLESTTGGGPGSLDVQYLENKRNIETGGEASGTLRSGQQAKALADAMAAYKSNIAGAFSQTAAGKTDIDTETAQKTAEYMAMYNPGKLSGTKRNTNTNTKPPANTGSKPNGPTDTNTITPLPTYGQKRTIPSANPRLR